MLVFRASNIKKITEDGIDSILAALVQAWMISERTNNRLLIEWNDLPPSVSLSQFYRLDRVESKPNYVYLEYREAMYPEEKNKHLLLYYYRRIFSQILYIKHSSNFDRSYKHIALWGNESFAKFDTVGSYYSRMKRVIHKFGVVTDDGPTKLTSEVEVEVAIEDYIQELFHEDKLSTTTSEPVENWNAFLHLAACDIIVSKDSPFITTVLRAFKAKEFWLVATDSLQLQK